MQDRGTGRDRLASRPSDLRRRFARRQLRWWTQRMKATSSTVPVASLLCFVRKQEFFSCFADGNQCHVVILRCGAGKVAHVRYDLLYNSLCAIVRAGTDRFHHALKPELVSLSI